MSPSCPERPPNGREQLKDAVTRVLGLTGIALGLACMLAGAFLAAVSDGWGRRVTDSAAALAVGLDGAESVVTALCDDVEGTTSILEGVRRAIVQTAGVVSRTRSVLDRADYTGSETVDFSLLLADDLDGISSMLGPMGGGRLSQPASRLRMISASGDSILILLSGLRARLGSLSGTLYDVAAAVDSLSADLTATRSAMSEAGASLAEMRETMQALSTTRIASTAILASGLLLFFLGVQEVLLGAILARVGPWRTPSDGCGEETSARRSDADRRRRGSKPSRESSRRQE